MQWLLDTTLCDKVCQWLATGRWISLDTPVSSTNKTDHHYIAGILLFFIFMFFVGRLIVCLTDSTRNQSTHFLLFVLISCQRYVLDVNNILKEHVIKWRTAYWCYIYYWYTCVRTLAQEGLGGESCVKHQKSINQNKSILCAKFECGPLKTFLFLDITTLE
jgi:hypothetical protein